MERLRFLNVGLVFVYGPTKPKFWLMVGFKG